MLTAWQSLLLSIPPLAVLGAGMIPSRWANQSLSATRRVAVALLAVIMVWGVAASLFLARNGPWDIAWLEIGPPFPLTWGIYFDHLAAVMTLLISFIGLIITCFSCRYLAGEAEQGRFLKWVLMTIGAVLLLVISRNLIMTIVAWILTSYGLHQLLIHYSDRPWAIWAARKKFLISRIGDVALGMGVLLTFLHFGTFDYPALFVAVQSMQETATDRSWPICLIALCFVMGAMTKSAQFPFHSWLPDTMETPTPVSALMHAGIINAGGFLLIRLSPLISFSPLALNLLAVVGALTALLGAVIMTTQTSIKRSLAYSTIAQMGFMMLQCGLGAFSAALLHIVAHSLYKAHAFLTSGSVLDAAAHFPSNLQLSPKRLHPLASLSLALSAALLISAGAIWLLGIPFTAKPGAAVLGVVLTIALTHLLWSTMSSGCRPLVLQSLLAAMVVASGYFAAFQIMDHLLALSISHAPRQPNWLDTAILGLLASGFLGLFLLQAATSSSTCHPSLQALYVHAANGFYLDIPARRLTARFWGLSTPTP